MPQAGALAGVKIYLVFRGAAEPSRADRFPEWRKLLPALAPDDVRLGAVVSTLEP